MSSKDDSDYETEVKEFIASQDEDIKESGVALMMDEDFLFGFLISQ